MNLGVVIVGRKRPGFDQEWNALMRQRCLAAIQSLGLTPIGADTPVVDDQTIRATLDQIRRANCDALLVLQPSLGHGQLALSLSQQWDLPLILWATPERPEVEIVSSCSLVAQHLWASILRQAHHPFEFIYGDGESKTLRPSLDQAIHLCRTVAALRQSKIGLVGTYAPGFIDLEPDASLIRRMLGTQLHRLSLPQFIDRVRSIDENAIRADVDAVRALRLPMHGVTDEDLPINSRYYLAMLQLMKEENLAALAVQCWPELPEVLGQWPYLAMSRLADQGHVVSMEGDVDGALTSMIGKLLGTGIGFITDWLEHDASTITFWHPGMAALHMCDNPSLGKHFNIQKPLVVDGPLHSNQPFTVARLWRCDDRYHLTAFEGRSITPRRKLTGNGALIEFPNRDIPRLCDDLLHAGLPHHVVLFQGHYRDLFHRLTRMLNLMWIG
jgi:L-fucose isomerase-like protein